MQLDKYELAWAAGLFDGEGTVGVRRNGAKATTRRIGLSLGMTDKAPVERFLQAVGVGKIYYNQKQSKYPNAKPNHRFAVHSFERVQYIIAILWLWLSIHKRKQAIEAILAWRGDRHLRHDKSYPRLCKRGHDLRTTERTTPSGSRWCKKCQPIRVREYRARIGRE